MKAIFAAALIGQAQAFVPIPDFAPSLIPFDVKGGYVNAWSHYLPCEANTATFKAKILQSYPNPAWNSQVRINLSDNPTVDKDFENYDSNSIDEAIAITLVSENSGIVKSRSLAVIERQSKNEKRFPFDLFPNAIKDGHVYFVRLRWDSVGLVSASIDDGPELTFKMHKRVTTISLFASGVRAEIHDFTIGRIGPRPKDKEACGIS